MCGRYATYLPAEALRRTFRTVNSLPDFVPSRNVTRSQIAPVVRRHSETGERHLDLLEWGLLRWWQRSLGSRRPINVHAKTMLMPSKLRSTFLRRRCIVPADAFYGWKVAPEGRQPYAIARQDGQPMAFAGLWENYRAPDGTVLSTFAIVITAANAALAELHDRMPVVLEPAEWPVWLGEVEGDLASLLHPPPVGTLRVLAMDGGSERRRSEAGNHVAWMLRADQVDRPDGTARSTGSVYSRTRDR